MNKQQIEQCVRRNYEKVQERIRAACKRVGRAAEEVRLVAVTKYAQIEWIEPLLEAGVSDLGENRPQQLIERAAVLPQTVRWHMIGHLQRNKVRPILPVVEWIHSVDTLRLLERIDRLAAELKLKPRLLLEVNVSGEETKFGFSPDELNEQWERVLECEHVELCGLMTMAPFVQDPEQTRPVFRQLRQLRDQLQTRSGTKAHLSELSMGMSNDFEVAVEEGATMVRIGSLLFEGLL